MTSYRPWWPWKGVGEVRSSCKDCLYGQELKRAVCLAAAIVRTSPWFLSTQLGEQEEGGFSFFDTKTPSALPGP